MAIIDVLKYDGPNDVLVWKWRPESGSKREEELRQKRIPFATAVVVKHDVPISGKSGDKAIIKKQLI